MENHMTQITTPDEVLLLFSACEAAYADASQKGYADNPNVVGAVAGLKSAYRVLVIANSKLTASDGPFDKTIATWRAHKARGSFHEACVKLQTTIKQASLEDHLYNRCLVLLKSELAQDERQVDILDLPQRRKAIGEHG
jgi:hypothetical protein